jgi:hypothetical protein
MIDALLASGRGKRSASKQPPSGAAVEEKGPNATALLAELQRDNLATEQIGAVPAESAAGVETCTQSPPLVRREEAVVVDLPGVTCSAAERQLRPTLVVGIGGLAAVTLRGVRRRLQERFGSLDAVPAIRMLLVDTDRNALYQATQGDPGWAFQPHETLALPLRRTQDYRRDSDKFLRWLSRRWLYNIPRSQETEGLRPLGRLAFVDHLDEVRKHLVEALKRVSASPAAKATSETTAIEFSTTAPRIVLVASICGGTGSGIVLDAAYLARSLGRELGFNAAEVTGLLLYATPVNAAARQLATVNAYACLSELHHFTDTARGYPGDSACRLSASGQPPLDHAYLVHLGDDLPNEQLVQEAASVAAYVYRDLVTDAGPLLAKCRAASQPANPSEVRLRTLGVCQVGCLGTTLADSAVELLARGVVQRWSGETPTQSNLLVRAASAAPVRPRRSEGKEAIDVSHLALEYANTLELELPRLRSHADQLLEAGLGKPPAVHLGTLVQQFVAQQLALHGEDGALDVGPFVETLDRLLGPRWEEAQLPAPATTVEKAIVKQIEALAASRGTALVDWLYQTANGPETGAQGAQKAAEWFVQHLRALEKETREAGLSLRQEILTFEQVLQSGPLTESRAMMLGIGRGKKGVSYRDEVLLQLALRRAIDLSLRCVARLIQALLKRATAALEALRDLRRALGDLVYTFSPGSPLARNESNGLAGVAVAVGDSLQARLDELTDRLLQTVSREVLGEQGLRRLIEQPDSIARLPSQLRQAARQCVRAALGEFDLAGWLLEEDEDRLSEVLAKAEPVLLRECGGGRRYLICQLERPSPEADDQRLPDAFCEAFHVEPMLTAGRDPELVVCCEAENVPLARAAANLAEDAPDLPQLAARVRTRIDVAWASLPE